MQKFDTSCGLTKKQIDFIKYAVKKEISKQLPILPELIETKLFLEGRDAWIYNWSLKQYSTKPKHEIFLEVVTKLKKEFHKYIESTHFKFSCKVQPRQDIYQTKVSITKTDA